MKKILVFGAFLFCMGSMSAQTLTANAGNDTTVCYNSPGVILGGSPTASGGTAPYSYSWSPAVSVNNPAIPNPTATTTAPMMFTVTVTDSAGATAIDSVLVNLFPEYQYDAGNDTGICIGDSVTLGASVNTTSGGCTFSWSPTTDISNPNGPRPMFTGTVTTTYTLTVTSPNCSPKISNVTVTVNPLPIVDALGGTTIDEGQSTPLTATGAMDYFWGPGGSLSNTQGSLTNAEPSSTTTYTVIGIDDNGCQDWDTVTVFVNPNDSIVLYNTFSPNGDGINDFFHIGNIGKYPECRLEVYDRTGQEVYAKTGYDNSWDGTNYGDRLPETTYFFTLDLGDGSPPYYGHVTIVR